MKTIISLILIIITFNSFAQTNQDLKVFLDCSNGGSCYNSYMIEKLPFLNYVRDRMVADVHIISKINYSDAGNEQRVLFFVGKNNFIHLQDTITYNLQSNAMDNERRDAFVNNILLGLIPYLNKTDLIKNINISIKNDTNKTKRILQKDKWNYWVIQTGLSGSMDGNKNYQSNFVNVYTTANRETKIEKTNFSISYNKNNQTFVSDDSTTIKSTFQNFYSEFYHLKKLNNHWGLGAFANIRNSIYSNYKHRIVFGPKVEYSFFDYKDFNSKRLVLIYDINPVFNSYYDTTIYLKTKETLFNQSLSLIGSFTQPWGNINLGIFFNNYFPDMKKNALSFNGALTTKITKGLNVSVWGDYTIQNNQINLRKNNISTDQLLLRNRELFTSYQYSIGIAIGYRFGSTNNNNINPIFRGFDYNINL